MIYVLLLLFGCTALAYMSMKKQYATNDIKKENNFSFSTIAFIILLIILVCYAGLRTYGNDTTSYIKAFVEKIPSQLSSLKSVNWSIGSNPLFQVYEIIIKALISDNPQVFLFISSLITVSSILLFMRKYAENFGFSVFLYISFAVYTFSFAAIKQCLAMAIAIWAVPLFLHQKRIRSLLLILLAMLVHPYVIVFIAFYCLNKSVWDKRSFIIIGITIILGFTYTTFVENVLSAVSMIGEEYDISKFEGSGTNLFRLLVYWAPPVLSFIYRKEIREKNDRFFNICVNLSFLSACFVLLAMFGAATPLGRMANYLTIFTCISLPAVIKCDFHEAMGKKYITFFVYLAFFVYYLSYYHKFMPDFFGNLFTDYYAHTSIFALF